MAIVQILQNVFMKKILTLLILFHLGMTFAEPDNGKLKVRSESSKIPSHQNDSSARRYHFISNRDSYVNAANSFGGGGEQTSFSQNSYVTPMQGGYSSEVGYGWTELDDSSQSSKGGGIDLLGLVGLIGLKGLKGTLPLVKKIALALIALSPVLIPLSIFKLIVIFLKPVITFGRDLNSDARPLTISSIDKMLEEVLSRESDERCMERIACEGLFKSVPRIFMKILGDNYKPTALRKRRSTQNKDDESGGENPNDPRRKDLASLALNKLKYRYNFAKKPNPSENPTKVANACQQYKCSTLF